MSQMFLISLGLIGRILQQIGQSVISMELLESFDESSCTRIFRDYKHIFSRFGIIDFLNVELIAFVLDAEITYV